MVGISDYLISEQDILRVTYTMIDIMAWRLLIWLESPAGYIDEVLL